MGAESPKIGRVSHDSCGSYSLLLLLRSCVEDVYTKRGDVRKKCVFVTRELTLRTLTPLDRKEYSCASLPMSTLRNTVAVHLSVLPSHWQLPLE